MTPYRIDANLHDIRRMPGILARALEYDGLPSLVRLDGNAHADQHRDQGVCGTPSRFRVDDAPNRVERKTHLA